MIDGGPATLVYGYIFCWLGALVTAASLAEMASMYEYACPFDMKPIND
jgi:amino acid permease